MARTIGWEVLLLTISQRVKVPISSPEIRDLEFQVPDQWIFFVPGSPIPVLHRTRLLVNCIFCFYDVRIRFHFQTFLSPYGI